MCNTTIDGLEIFYQLYFILGSMGDIRCYMFVSKALLDMKCFP